MTKEVKWTGIKTAVTKLNELYGTSLYGYVFANLDEKKVFVYQEAGAGNRWDFGDKNIVQIALYSFFQIHNKVTMKDIQKDLDLALAEVEMRKIADENMAAEVAKLGL